MAKNYFFKVANVECYTTKNDLQNVAFLVQYTYNIEDDQGNFVSDSGVASLPEPDASTFTAVEELTQEDVISWLETIVDVEAIKVRLDHKYNERVNPTKKVFTIPVQQTVQGNNIADEVAGEESAATEESTEETV